MPVPPDDMLCRFIKPEPEKWNPRLQLPTPRAFKQVDLSVWHPGRLNQYNARLEDLLIEGLVGWGQAHHTAGDYVSFAHKVAEEEGVLCQVQVEWRPNEVDPPWYKWRHAHVQVEVTQGPDDLPLELRRLLAANSRHIAPPDPIH